MKTEIKKIEQPETGWTIEQLKTYNFKFNKNKEIKDNIQLVISLLNKYLPFFYIEQRYLRPEFCSITVIVNDEFLINLSQASQKNYFSQNILNFLVFYYTKDAYEYMQNPQNNDVQNKAKELFKAVQIHNESSLKEGDDGGIYGIYSEDEKHNLNLLYIGLTTRKFKKRWDEHMQIIKREDKIPIGMEKAYAILRAEYDIGKTLLFKPLIIFSKLKINRSLTKGEKEAMELAFINYFQPSANKAGVDVPYIFNDN